MTDAEADHDLRGAAGVATVAAIAVIAVFVAGKAARDAILLSAFPVTMLPLFVGLTAAMSLPLVVFAGRLMSRIGPARLMPALNLLSAALLVGEFFLLEPMPRLAAVICFFHLGSLGAVLVSGYWSIINERFDARSAKRHIGRIGLGATVGGVIGGVVAERSAVYFELGAILLVLAGLHVLSTFFLWWLTPARAMRRARPVDDTEPGATWTGVRLVAKSSLLRNLGLLIVLGAVGAAALDYVFKAELTRAAGPEGPLRFFAIYHTITNVLTALVQLIVARAVVTRAGVARTIGVLPGVVAASGFGALLVPGIWPVLIARAAEMITRSSIYRAAYELIYAPLPEQDKRPTKVVLDVGAERIGDLIGSQIVAVILFALPSPNAYLLGCAMVAGIAALWFAALLPRNYTTALEQSLLMQADGADPGAPPPDASLMWSQMGRATLSEHGDMTMMSLLDLRAIGPPAPATRQALFRGSVTEIKRDPDASTLSGESEPQSEPGEPHELDPLAARIGELRSGDATRVRRALLAPLVPELAAHVVPLIGWDAAASMAVRSLRKIAPRCTGTLVDALLDATQEFTIRRRLPAIIEAGEPGLARWGLWRGLSDTRFEVRYRCGRALARMQAAKKTESEDFDAVLALVSKELRVGNEVWRSHRLLDVGEVADQDADHEDEPGRKRSETGDHESQVLHRIVRKRSAIGLDHVFTLLGLSLPPQPVRIAFQGLFTDDRALRATALEYLESVLPPEVRDSLFPLLEADQIARPGPRPTAEVAAALMMSQPMIAANLRDLERGGGRR